jgi:hypothetical protein
MKDVKTDREKDLDKFIESLGTEDDFKNKLIDKVEILYEQYEGELKDYKFVLDLNSYEKIKPGGYIRYINFDHNLKWGGILLKKVINNNRHVMVLQNSNMKRYSITFENNYIFYREHKTQSDKLRDIFLSYLDTSK